MIESSWLEPDVARRLEESVSELGLRSSSPSFEADLEGIDSTRIVSCVRAGEIARATAMIGRPFELSVRVEPRSERPRRGPVAGVRGWSERGVIVPPAGLYAARARVAGRTLPLILHVPDRGVAVSAGSADDFSSPVPLEIIVEHSTEVDDGEMFVEVLSPIAESEPADREEST
jgi:FAD synthase